MAEEKARPTYYDFIRALDNQLNEYGMTYSEQLLYHTLLLINNRKHWVDWFHCTDAYLTDFMGIGTTAMKNARNKLKQNGMIDFITSKQRGTSTKYHVCNEFCTCSINVQTNNKRSTNEVQTNNKPDTNKDKREKIEDFKENKKEKSALCKKIIDYLNEQAGTAYRSTSQETQKHINARLREGFVFDDFKKAIDNKCSEWLGTEMQTYLRPQTLFGTKFEGYVNSVPAINKRESVYGDSGLDDAELERIMREKM